MNFYSDPFFFLRTSRTSASFRSLPNCLRYSHYQKDKANYKHNPFYDRGGWLFGNNRKFSGVCQIVKDRYLSKISMWPHKKNKAPIETGAVYLLTQLKSKNTNDTYFPSQSLRLNISYADCISFTFSRIFCSTSAASSGLSWNNCFTVSLPWPNLSVP